MVSHAHTRPRAESLRRIAAIRRDRTSSARILVAVAALFTLAASRMVLWQATFRAPAYPDEAPRITASSRGLSGDLDELDRLDQYIGVRIPRHLPELGAVGPMLLALGAALLLAAAWPGRGGRWPRMVAGVCLFAGLATALALGQADLYAIGHHRAEHTPLAGMHDFTPLILGPTRVGNFHIMAAPGFGGWVLAAAVLLVAVAVVAEFRRAREEPS